MSRFSRTLPIAVLAAVVAGCGGSHSTPPPPSQPSVVSAELKGDRHASGTVVIGLNRQRQKLCWTFALSGVHAPSSAHLRKAPPHKVGPVIVSFGPRFVRSGCAPAPRGVIKDLGKHASAYYVDVLTRRGSTGGLRGQLRLGT